MEIKSRFDHYNFNVTNLNKSIEFYNKTLGLNESKRMVADDGSYIIVYLTDNTTNFLLELTWLKDHPSKYDLGECEYHLCMRVSNDYNSVRNYHSELGVICFENEKMGLYFIEDPDGYWIEILPLNDK